MPSTTERKEAIRRFKERIPLRGAFALRCRMNGRIWVGSSPNLDAMKNRLWFCLRNGTGPDKALQEEWDRHGEQAFEYEILERLGDDVSPLALGDLLKEKRLHWIARLAADGL
jgi:hypothetical protein